MLKTLSPICCRWFKIVFPRTLFGMLIWREIPAGQELEEPVGLLGGLEPPHRRRRLSKGRDLPPPLLPPTFAACVPIKATPLAVSPAPVYSYEWRSKAVKPGRLFRLRDGSGPAVLQALFVKGRTNQIDPKPLLEPKAPELLLWRIKQRRKIKYSN